MPSWAQKTDSCRHTRWNKEKACKSRRGEYIGAIIFNLIFLWIVNKIPEWNIGFIKDNYMVVLWILNVNIFIQIGGNALMLLLGFPAIRYISRSIIEAAGFVTMMALYYIYPFDFTHFHGLAWLDWLVPIILIIGMVVSAVKVISNLWKLIFRK